MLQKCVVKSAAENLENATGWGLLGGAALLLATGCSFQGAEHSAAHAPQLAISSLLRHPEQYANARVALSGIPLLAQENFIDVVHGRNPASGRHTVQDIHRSQAIAPSLAVSTIYPYGEKRGAEVVYTFALTEKNGTQITLADFQPRNASSRVENGRAVEVVGTWERNPEGNYYLRLESAQMPGALK